MKFNRLPDGFEGEQRRETEFDSVEEKLAYDARNLSAKAMPLSVVGRKDDDVEALKRAIAKEWRAVNSEQTPDKYPYQLSPEDADATLRTFESRFHSEAGMKLHGGVEWTRVKSALLASPEALWSIHGMEAQGHEPDVYFADDTGFDVGTCSIETPEQGRNCVYDEEAAEWLKISHGTIVNGSAVAMAKKLGIDLMSPDQYTKQLQVNGKFDSSTRSWLKTDVDTRKAGYAEGGYRRNNDVFLNQRSAIHHTNFGSWRGSRRVKWAA